MTNQFNDHIKHNLSIGLKNAANAIKHGEIGVALEFLKNTDEILSLIETEGEHWIEVRGGNYPTPEQAKSGIIVNEKGGHIYSWGLHDATAEGIEAYFKMEQFTHWCHKPAPPVTLSEASNHSFQQGVEIDLYRSFDLDKDKKF